MVLYSPYIWLIYVLLQVATVCAQESVEEAAKLARKLVHFSSSSIGTMATVYPQDHPDLSAQPFSLQEYYASCFNNGSLTLLFMPISRHSQNILRSPSHAASISITGEHPTANRARVSLIGSVTLFPNVNETPERERIQACYLEKHRDARWWTPGPREPHVAYWARFDPHSVYYVGGFGSEHYIGYIPLDMYQAARPQPDVGKVGVAGRLLIQGK